MSLANLLKKDWLAQVATATPATYEPHKQTPVTRVATVAVANPTDLSAVRAVTEIAEPPDWQALDRAYQAHHINCSTCIGAGKGYGLRCGTGAALWAAYDQTPKPVPVLVKTATHSSSAEVHISLLTAATPDEINLMAARLELFAGRGVADAEKLVDRLLVRDREGDPRGACDECKHLFGRGPGRWKYGDRSPMQFNELTDAYLGAAFVHLNLHHCNSLERTA